MAVRKLVASILQFLTQQLDDGSITDDSRESLEVAIQCLESAYNVQAADAQKNLNLLELYQTLEQSSQATSFASTTTAPLPPQATPEAKAEAEALKNEGNQLMKLEKYQEALSNYTKFVYF